MQAQRVEEMRSKMADQRKSLQTLSQGLQKDFSSIRKNSNSNSLLPSHLQRSTNNYDEYDNRSTYPLDNNPGRDPSDTFSRGDLGMGLRRRISVEPLSSSAGSSSLPTSQQQQHSLFGGTNPRVTAGQGGIRGFGMPLDPNASVRPSQPLYGGNPAAYYQPQPQPMLAPLMMAPQPMTNTMGYIPQQQQQQQAMMSMSAPLYGGGGGGGGSMLPAMPMTHMQPLPMMMSPQPQPQQYHQPMGLGLGNTGGGWPHPQLPQGAIGGGVGADEMMALRQMERAVEQLERENASLLQGTRPGLGPGLGLGGDHMDNDNGSMSMTSLASVGSNSSAGGGRFGNNNNNNNMLTQQQRVQQLRADKLARLDLQHEEDMMMMQYEMEKIKQKRALDELKATLAEENEEQLAKERQMSWLVDQKQKLHEMKVILHRYDIVT